MYGKEYFVGGTVSNYDDYQNCKGVLEDLAGIYDKVFQPKSFFDGGGAYGFAVDYFARQGKTARGCDISEFAVSHSSNMYVSGLDSIPEQEKSYDIVASSEVLEHVPENLVRKAISELHRISQRYTVLCIALADCLENEDKPDPGDDTHITMKTRGWWERVIKELGINRNIEKEKELDNDTISKRMFWSGRFFVLER